MSVLLVQMPVMLWCVFNAFYYKTGIWINLSKKLIINQWMMVCVCVCLRMCVRKGLTLRTRTKSWLIMWKTELHSQGWALPYPLPCGRRRTTPAATFWLSGFGPAARRAVKQPWLKGKARNPPPSRDVLETGMRTTLHITSSLKRFTIKCKTRFCFVFNRSIQA